MPSTNILVVKSALDGCFSVTILLNKLMLFQQGVLIKQLQEQHYQQYMHQIYQQQLSRSQSGNPEEETLKTQVSGIVVSRWNASNWNEYQDVFLLVKGSRI